MENAKFAVGSMLRQGSQNLFGDLDAAIIQVSGRRRVFCASDPPEACSLRGSRLLSSECRRSFIIVFGVVSQRSRGWGRVRSILVVF